MIVAFGGFIFPIFLRLVRNKLNLKVEIPDLFLTALTLMSISILCLVFGILNHDLTLHVNSWWVVGSYSIQSIAELCIAPVGSSMIAVLARDSLQGIMMGSWMFFSGISAIIAGKVSSLVTATNYSKNINEISANFYSLFVTLLVFSLVITIVLALLRNFIKKLIHPEC
ncbi:MAG: hypothetical protein KIT27_11065 [Legionellales bacterium]|nr:hypothetical protein [Legionellales bacterium]